MIHQFAHGGDLHLGPNARNADRRAAFDQYVREGLALPHLAAWFLPGDLNHGRMTIDDRNYLADRFTTMANRAPIVIVRGNHDLPGDLDIFEKLATAHPVYCALGTPHVLRIRLATMAFASIFCLPYPTEAGLLAHGVAPGDLVQTAKEKLQAIFLQAAGVLMDARAKGDLVLALGHINVAGSITGTGQPNIGQEIELDPTLITILGATYFGLNHIHVGQDIGGASYPGSFCRLDWGEVHPKRWLQVDLTVEGPLTSCEVRDRMLDVAPMYHVNGKLSRANGFTWTVEPPILRFVENGDPWIKTDEYPADLFAGAEVRLRVEYPASEKDLIGNYDVRAPFAMAKRFELEYVAIPDRALRAPAVAAAKTLPEKVRAWAETTGTVLPDRVVEKLVALEHGDAGQLLKSFEDTLNQIISDGEAVAA